MSTPPNPNVPPSVDIALATYNGERYLPELLYSLEQQTHRNWHLVIGDDGSVDDTPYILKKFVDDHPTRTTLLPPSDRLGARGNFSRILQVCHRDYVLLADQDDVWLPTKIECGLHRAQAIERENQPGTAILIHSDALVTDGNLNILDTSFWHHQNLSPKYGLKLKNLLVQNVITGCTVLVNRPLLNLALPLPQEAIMHDWWMGLTAAAFGKINYIAEPTLFYRQHANNQIGAKQWSLRHVAAEASSGIQALKKRIEATQQQAAAFKMCFSNQLKKEEHDLLDAYFRLSRCGPIRRRLLAASNQFHKCGWVRTAGFYMVL